MVFMTADGDWRSAALALGIDVWHAEGCPGVFYSGVGIVIDWRLPDSERRAAIGQIVAYVRAQAAAE